MSFRIRGLDAAQFQPLFVFDDAALAERGMRRIVADAPNSAPCRVTMDHAAPGELVLLLNFAHQVAHSPYRASGPIFVRQNATATFDRVDDLPPVFFGRPLSVRAYDEAGMMTDADLVEGDPRPLFEAFFADPAVDRIHVHYARRGCYGGLVTRA